MKGPWENVWKDCGRSQCRSRADRLSGIVRPLEHQLVRMILIEYFEASKTSDKSRARANVRVKVTPSPSARKNKHSSDAIPITDVNKEWKPSYTHRIALRYKSIERTRIPRSSKPNISSRPPTEGEITNHDSDLSDPRTSRDIRYHHGLSDIRSMPPDTLLDGPEPSERA